MRGGFELPALFLSALLIAGCAKESPVYDQAMRDALGQLRQSLAKFQNDNGRYPHTLDELVPRYLPKIPADPVTGSATTWRLTMEETVRPSSDFSTAPAAPSPAQIVAVHSGAPGTDSAGKRWSDY